MTRKQKTEAEAHAVGSQMEDQKSGLTVMLEGRKLPIFAEAEGYQAFLEKCLEPFFGEDPIARLLVEDVADETWEIRRVRAMRENILQQRFTGILETLLPSLIRKGYRTYDFAYKFAPTDCPAYDEMERLEFEDFEDKKEFLEYLQDEVMTEYEWEARELLRAYRAGNPDARREIRHMLAMDNSSEEELYARIVAVDGADLAHLDMQMEKHLRRRAALIKDVERHSEFVARHLQQQLGATDADFMLVDEEENHTS